MANVHILECWCKLCLSQCLERFDQFNCRQLLNLFTTILQRSTSEAFNEAFDKTMRTVVAGKAYRIAAQRESGYKQLKRHFQWLGYGVKDSKMMSNKLGQAWGGAHLQVFPCCAKMVSSRLMKLSYFWYNYIGHHLK